MLHHTQALIAGGTFNGDLYVWDLSQEGDMQRSRVDTLSEVRHREPICNIMWQYSMTEYNKYGNKAQAYRLVTLGADGQVLVWMWHKLETPIYGYAMMQHDAWVVCLDLGVFQHVKSVVELHQQQMMRNKGQRTTLEIDYYDIMGPDYPLQHRAL